MTVLGGKALRPMEGPAGRTRWTVHHPVLSAKYRARVKNTNSRHPILIFPNEDSAIRLIGSPPAKLYKEWRAKEYGEGEQEPPHPPFDRRMIDRVPFPGGKDLEHMRDLSVEYAFLFSFHATIT